MSAKLHALPPALPDPATKRLRHITVTLPGFEDVSFWYNTAITGAELQAREQALLDQAYAIATATVTERRARQEAREGLDRAELIAARALTLVRANRAAQGDDPPPPLLTVEDARALATADDRDDWRTEREAVLNTYTAYVGTALQLARWDEWPFAAPAPDPADLATWPVCPLALAAWIANQTNYADQLRPDPKSPKASPATSRA